MRCLKSDGTQVFFKRAIFSQANLSNLLLNFPVALHPTEPSTQKHVFMCLKDSQRRMFCERWLGDWRHVICLKNGFSGARKRRVRVRPSRALAACALRAAICEKTSLSAAEDRARRTESLLLSEIYPH